MEYRILGRTGLKVSLIGMGGIPIQRVDSETANDVVKAALEEGINFFDSARGYTDSEEKMGAVLSKSKDSIIATKSMARTKGEMSEEIKTSLKNFGVSCIHLYQLHNVKSKEELDLVLSENGALKALLEAKEKGLIKFIGITGHVMEVLVEAVRTDLFDTVQFPFNAVERQALDELLPLANKMNIGTIVMKPLAGGAFKEAELALKWLLDYDVATIIPGVDSVEQVRKNAYLGHKISKLTPEERQRLEQEVRGLGQRFCRRCEYCQPCPQGINLPMVFILEGYWSRYGLKDWSVERYGSMDKSALDCLECGQCEEKCPYGLPIIEMLKEAHSKLGS